MKEWALGIATCIVMFLLIVKIYEQDMKVCQLSHSFETCQNALNR